MDTNSAGQDISRPYRKALYRIGGFALSFLAGAIAVLAARYLLFGRGIQLSPDVFISLIFTVAIGAASLVLALLAINYGRVSEKVITERADKSIEIQMNLFQKSLDLQTQLFNKTMSALETIGRSTGVTEQRLGDIISLYQNPTFLKQIAGRAVEETTQELTLRGKEDGNGEQSEEQLAERLTENIVKQLSSKLEGLEKAVQNSRLAGGESDYAVIRSIFEQEERDRAAQREITRRITLVKDLIRSIPGAELGTLEPPKGNWDVLAVYKDKKIALDLRRKAAKERLGHYDESIALLFEKDVDGLSFLFWGGFEDGVEQDFTKRARMLGGRVKYLAIMDETRLQADLTLLFEQFAAGPTR